MASDSRRRSGSSGTSGKRRKVVIAAEESLKRAGQQPSGADVRTGRGTGSGAGRGRRVSSSGAPDTQARHSSPRTSRPAGTVRQRASHVRGRTAAERVANARKSERERRLRRLRLVMYARIALAITVVGGVIFGAVRLYRSDVFAVKRVDVLGNQRVSTEEVIALAQVPSDATLLRFPDEEVGQRLEADPRIAAATVTRDFPDAMRIRVEERIPMAYVDVGTNSLWVVDADAFVVATETPDATSTLAVVRDLPSFEATPGAVVDSPELSNALDVLKGLSAELGQRIRAVSAPSVDKTTLITTDGIEILVGPSDDIARKDLIARRILDEQAGKVVYVNVRSVDRPTWRGVGE